MSAPKVGSKAGPSPEAVAAKLEDKLKSDPPLTLEAFWNMARLSGAQFLGLEDEGDGSRIAIKGIVRDRTVSVEALAPTGTPFAVTARAVLESFRESAARGEQVERTIAVIPNLPPDVPRQETPEEKEARWTASLGPKPAPVVPGGTSTTRTTPGGPVTFKEHTSMIKKASGEPQHRHKPGELPPGAAGMCDHCKVQPVMHSGSKFCGARCAQAFHTAILCERQGVKLPRIK